eukprot:Skav220063  [mRNA]  locus=scaffold1709:139383:161802:- [translate_table: standard]
MGKPTSMDGHVGLGGEYSFIEGYDRDGDAEEISGIHPFEELSLYVERGTETWIWRARKTAEERPGQEESEQPGGHAEASPSQASMVNCRCLVTGGEAIDILQHLLESTPRSIYWAYLCARARALNLPRQTPEDLVLIRIACLMRIHPESQENDVHMLMTAWHRLGEAERQTLTDHFLADGIDEVAFVFDFLPDCVANAIKNPIVTLLGLLEVLEELLGSSFQRLLQTLRPAVAMNPDLKDAKIINVDLADMSEFITCVQNHFVFETCVSRCKIRFAGRRAQCEMTGGNWGRIHEEDSDLTSLAYCVRDVMQRQQTVESHLLKLQNYYKHEDSSRDSSKKDMTFTI